MHLHLTSLQSRKLLSEANPRVASFRYANYDVDPRPRVLVMGKYSPPTTGNELIAGINLNYLSQGQISRLAKASDKVFGDGSLKIRYRRLSRLLPDIAQYYRTYNAEHINMISADDFLAEPQIKQKSELEIRKPEIRKPEKRITSKKAQKPIKPEKPPKPSTPTPDPDPDRAKWQTKRRLYQPKSKRRTAPERRRDDDITRLAKNARYRQQQRRDRRELERQEPEEISIDDLNDIANDVDTQDDEVREDRYGGVVSFTPQQYILTHSPGMFNGNGIPKAVQNIRTGQIVVDSVDDCVEIITDAGWDYSNTIRYEIDNCSLKVLYDCDDEAAQKCIGKFLADKACGILLLNSKTKA